MACYQQRRVPICSTATGWRAYAKPESAVNELLKLKGSSIVFLDFSAWVILESQDSGSLIRKIADRGVSIALLASVDREGLRHVEKRGIRGLLPPHAEVEAVHNLLYELFAGRSNLCSQDCTTPESQVYRLSILQLKILRSLCRGRLERQVATELGMSHRAVKEHVSFTQKKLGFERTTQLVAAFRRIFWRNAIALTPRSARCALALLP